MHSTNLASREKLCNVKGHVGKSSMLTCGHVETSRSPTTPDSYPSPEHAENAATRIRLERWLGATTMAFAGPSANCAFKTLSKAEAVDDPTLIDWTWGREEDEDDDVPSVSHHGALGKKENPLVTSGDKLRSSWKRIAWEGGYVEKKTIVRVFLRPISWRRRVLLTVAKDKSPGHVNAEVDVGKDPFGGWDSSRLDDEMLFEII